jgi:uncharacterized protein YhbP (UPF0306 family)
MREMIFLSEDVTAVVTVVTETAQVDLQISTPTKAIPAIKDAENNAELFAAGMVELTETPRPRCQRFKQLLESQSGSA